MSFFYVLDERDEPIECPDPSEFFQWITAHDRNVAYDVIGESEISTVFFGVNIAQTDPPRVWETMIFGGPLNGKQQRYASKAEALHGHALCVAMLRAGLH